MITITELAAKKVLELGEQEGKVGPLRVFVTGGGCAGFSYGMAFDEVREDDEVAVQHGIEIVIDKESLPLLKGATIDYVESLTGSGFTIENPNAVKSCSCGHSFNTDGDPVRSHC
jgi:iron-sulfur cluster assembly accessory protein